jgi:hypothetical protein
MNKRSIFLIFLLILAVQFSLFAGSRRESPTTSNIYARFGYNLSQEQFIMGLGYEGALGRFFSLGAFAGFSLVDDKEGYDILLNPRFYFGSALENFFVGANLGYSKWGNRSDFSLGANLGYKLVFGSRSAGFSLEPSVAYDFTFRRFNIGIALGVAWGGKAPTPTPRPAPAARETRATPAAQAAQARVQEGIYVGIITFGPDAEDITGGPIYLDSAGLARLNSLLDSKYRIENTIGTALFYAAHLGLANMKTAESRLPSDLKSVTMITFTDGLDVSSTGLSLPEIRDTGNSGSLQFAGQDLRRYQEFVKREIDNRTINGTAIDAYIVAIKGDDVTNVSAFENALGSLASSPSYIRQPSNMRSLNGMFEGIASNVVNDWTETVFTMITPQYPPGTRIRMTFGGEANAQQAENASLYVEGELAIRNRQYYLTNVRYGGSMSSNTATQVDGRIDGSRIIFEFRQFSGYNFNQNQTVLERDLRQWRMEAGETEWQINTEYQPGNESTRTVNRNSALVYLVLDKSSSIASDDVPQVRDAAKTFIRLLYDAYNQN